MNEDRSPRPATPAPRSPVGVSDYARTAATAIVAVTATIGAGLVIIAIAAVRPNAAIIDTILRSWARIILFTAGVQVHVRGADNVEPGRAYVVILNHRSIFDLVCPFVALPMPIRFLAKRELLTIPLFGAILRSLGMVPVDRAADHETINRDSRAVLRAGYSLIVFAEGTRVESMRTEPFKKGGFVIAQQSATPILPVTMIGTGGIVRPRGKLIHKAKVNVIIAEPIPTSPMNTGDLEELVSLTQRVIRDNELTSDVEDSE